jgi:outer membrane immunogenic protein
MASRAAVRKFRFARARTTAVKRHYKKSIHRDYDNFTQNQRLCAAVWRGGDDDLRTLFVWWKARATAKGDDKNNKETIRMKNVLLGAVGLAVTAAPAFAADLPARTTYPAKVPAVVAPIYDWSGFYVGINGGGGWNRSCWSQTSFFGVAVIPSASEGCATNSGGTAGGQVGYRWQAASWVFGVEAQGNWADFNGSNVSLVLPFISNQTKVDAFGLFTGQVGYAWNNALLYVKGGAAVTDNKYTSLVTATGLVLSNASETRWGGTVGAGFEYGFAPNWSVAVEYNHLFMGTQNNAFTGVAAGNLGVTTRNEDISQDVDVVTARVNYRFGGPVVAKY